MADGGIRRRTIMAAAGATTALAATPTGARRRPRGEGRTFVLAHGAWHGGWAWRRVAPLLEAEGARVFAPTFSGLAERRVADRQPPRLEDHVAELAAFLFNEDLVGVTLVGHSWGGMAITGAADRARERVAALVYLDAAVPRDGQSMITQKPGIAAGEAAETERALAALAPDGVWMGVLPLEAYGYLNLPEPEARWVAARLSPHPLGTWTEPLRLRNGGGEGLPRAYVHCNNPPLPMSSMPFHAAILKNDPAWRYREIPYGHGALISAPGVVRDALLDFSAG